MSQAKDQAKYGQIKGVNFTIDRLMHGLKKWYGNVINKLLWKICCCQMIYRNPNFSIQKHIDKLIDYID